jgi:protein-disulfide isomerase
MPKILSLALFLLCAAILPAAAADRSPGVTPQDHVMGKAKAPIAIIEYASLTCPHCAAFEKERYPEIKKAWVDTGKARYIYRDFPLDRYALLASAIARCAPADRYFAFIQSFFDTQASWAVASDPLAALKGIARLGGMDAASVDRCLADTKLQEAIVDTETQAHKEYGVDSTPTFFIIGANGTTKLVGEQSYADFSKALTAAMPKS